MIDSVPTQDDALRIIEALRLGIPPGNLLRYVTVGRDDEIQRLASLLDVPGSQLMLLHANYGAGKTHLLRLLREDALQRGYAAALLTLDAKSGVNFAFFEEIFGAIARTVMIPDGSTGITALFDAAVSSDTLDSQLLRKHRFYRLIRPGRHSPIIAKAIDWWMQSNLSPQQRSAIIDWMEYPRNFKTGEQQRDLLRRVFGISHLSAGHHEELRGLRERGVFRWATWGEDSRNGDFDLGDYSGTWAAINELDHLCRVAGYKGLVLLLDEFEDVIWNVSRGSQKARAFERLFELYEGHFNGLTAIAVTPDFVHRCKNVLHEKNITNYTVTDFEELPFMTLSSWTRHEIAVYCQRVLKVYQVAYQDFPAIDRLPDSVVTSLSQIAIQNRSPDTIRIISKHLTAELDRLVD